MESEDDESDLAAILVNEEDVDESKLVSAKPEDQAIKAIASQRVSDLWDDMKGGKRMMESGETPPMKKIKTTVRHTLVLFTRHIIYTCAHHVYVTL